MTPAVYVLVIILMAAGVIGSLLPFIPGTPLILVGALLYAIATDFDPVGMWHLLALVGLAALAYVLDAVSGALGTRTLGGSRWAMAGALVGGIAGLFFGPLGIIVGPIAGAIGFELLQRKDIAVAVKSGVGAVVGILLGVVAKLALSVVMVGLFAFWTWKG